MEQTILMYFRITSNFYISVFPKAIQYPIAPPMHNKTFVMRQCRRCNDEDFELTLPQATEALKG